jgi:hypothetical protein
MPSTIQTIGINDTKKNLTRLIPLPSATTINLIEKTRRETLHAGTLAHHASNHTTELYSYNHQI